MTHFDEEMRHQRITPRRRMPCPSIRLTSLFISHDYSSITHAGAYAYAALGQKWITFSRKVSLSLIRFRRMTAYQLHRGTKEGGLVKYALMIFVELAGDYFAYGEKKINMAYRLIEIIYRPPHGQPQHFLPATWSLCVTITRRFYTPKSLLQDLLPLLPPRWKTHSIPWMFTNDFNIRSWFIL